MQKDGRINAHIVGQTALDIAERAGIKNAPRGIVVLGTEEAEGDIGPDYPLSHEKAKSNISSIQKSRLC